MEYLNLQKIYSAIQKDKQKLQELAIFAKFLLFSILLFTASCSSLRKTKSAANAERFDIYLLIGQSNMAGRGEITLAERDTLQNVYLFNGTGWIPAANPFNKYSTVRKSLSIQKLGPGYSFAKKLAACVNKKIGLVVNAKGGTKIEWWEKGYTGQNDFDLYEKAVDQMKKAESFGKLKGIIWHQGEGNQSNPEHYMPLLKKLVEDLRNDLGKNVYFLAGELGKWRNSSIKINSVIDNIPSEISNADFVNTNGLTPLHGDSTNPHFDNRSQLILGRRYADKVLEKIYSLKPCKN